MEFYTNYITERIIEQYDFHIQNKEKIKVISGAFGAGKTTFIKEMLLNGNLKKFGIGNQKYFISKEEISIFELPMKTFKVRRKVYYVYNVNNNHEFHDMKFLKNGDELIITYLDEEKTVRFNDRKAFHFELWNRSFDIDEYTFIYKKYRDTKKADWNPIISIAIWFFNWLFLIITLISIAGAFFAPLIAMLAGESALSNYTIKFYFTTIILSLVGLCILNKDKAIMLLSKIKSIPSGYFLDYIVKKIVSSKSDEFLVFEDLDRLKDDSFENVMKFIYQIKEESPENIRCIISLDYKKLNPKKIELIHKLEARMSEYSVIKNNDFTTVSRNYSKSKTKYLPYDYFLMEIVAEIIMHNPYTKKNLTYRALKKYHWHITSDKNVYSKNPFDGFITFSLDNYFGVINYDINSNIQFYNEDLDKNMKTIFNFEKGSRFRNATIGGHLFVTQFFYTNSKQYDDSLELLQNIHRGMFLTEMPAFITRYINESNVDYKFIDKNLNLKHFIEVNKHCEHMLDTRKVENYNYGELFNNLIINHLIKTSTINHEININFNHTNFMKVIKDSIPYAKRIAIVKNIYELMLLNAKFPDQDNSDDIISTQLVNFINKNIDADNIEMYGEFILFVMKIVTTYTHSILYGTKDLASTKSELEVWYIALGLRSEEALIIYELIEELCDMKNYAYIGISALTNRFNQSIKDHGNWPINSERKQ